MQIIFKYFPIIFKLYIENDSFLFKSNMREKILLFKILVYKIIAFPTTYLHNHINNYYWILFFDYPVFKMIHENRRCPFLFIFLGCKSLLKN